MRKLILSLAAAGTALAVATPAAAQYYPQPTQSYGQPYGYGSGYGAPHYDYRTQSYGLQMRVQALMGRIDALRRAHVLRGERAERLRKEARSLQRRIRQAGAYGFNSFAANDVQVRLARLEQRVNEATWRGRYSGYNVGYGYNGYNNGYGYNAYAPGQYGYGRDDDDDDDRYEQEHERWHDDHDDD